MIDYGMAKAACWLRLAMLLISVSAQTWGASPPAVTVDGATQITDTSATISGTVNPNGLPTGIFVRWGTTPAYSQSGPPSDVAPLNTPVAVSAAMIGLSPSTTYHYQLAATNAAGSGYSTDMTLTTSAAVLQPPTVFTRSATAVTATSATIAGTVNPNGLPTTYYFHWGNNTAYGNVVAPVSVPAQSTPLDVSAGLTGLSPGTTYHYQLVATNNAGTTLGADQTFTSLSVISIDNHIFTYVTNNGAITIVAYSGPGGAVTIPGVITGLAVTAIGNGAFAEVSSLTNATIPGSVAAIGNSAFWLSGLTSVVIPDSVLYLGPSAFSSCSSLASLTIGHGVTNLGYSVFAGSGLTNVTIPDNVTTIGTEAFFYNTLLTNLTLPNSLTNIGDAAFSQCGSLAGVAIPDSVTYLGDAAFSFCGSLASLTIGSGVTTIRGGGSAGMYGTFMGCSSLTRLAIPNTVTNITDGPLHLGGSLGAFYGCGGLTNVTLGNGLTYLGVGAFSWCGNLVGIYFEGNAPTPGQNMFGEDMFHNTDLATLYYLPGTTGWGPTYASRPTMLWNPQALTGDASFGVRQGRFGFNIAGTADIPIVVEACTNLTAWSWVPLQSCTLTNGLLYFSDPGWTNYPKACYRIRSP